MILQNTIANISNEIYEEMGRPEDLTIPFISSFLRWNVGLLNSLIGSCYTINEETLEIIPEPNNMVKALFKLLFYRKYYNDMYRAYLKSAGKTLGGWVKLTEGDSSIQRANPSEIAKEYKALWQGAADAFEETRKLYLRKINVPVQVTGDDTIDVGYYYPNNYNPRFNRRY